MKKRIIAVVCMVLTACALTSPAAAASYTYNYKKEPVATPEAAWVRLYADEAYMKCGGLKQPSDMDVDTDGTVVIADTGNDRLVRLDAQYRFVEEIRELTLADGTVTALKAPTGVHMADNELVYIADSGNGRVLVADKALRSVKLQMTATAEEVFKDAFSFKPLKVAADKAGRTFVVADGVYDGLMEFDPNGKFLGFSGANKVKPNLVDLFWNLVGTEEQRKQRLKNVPTEFSNLDMSNDGFVYTVTSSVDQWNPALSEPVRKQTAMGINILRYNDVLGMPVGDLKFPFQTEDAKIKGPSKLTDVSANADYGYACLDTQRGRIFVYNQEGEILFAFGGSGTVAGTFQQPSALVLLKEGLAVLDTTLGTVTVFEYSDYAKLIIQAQNEYLNGDYTASLQDWQNVLKINSNLDMAYTGVGKIYIREGRYAEAMTYLKLGGNKPYYSKAFEYNRKETINRRFPLLAAGAAVLVLLLTLYVMRWRKVLKVRVGLKKYAWYTGLTYGLYVITHPFDGFWDLTHEKRGNKQAAGILYALFTLTFVLQGSCKGFLFRPYAQDFNLLTAILTALLPIALWCLCNWAVTTLLDGDGKPSEIVIAMAYVTLPYTLINIPLVVLSHVLTLEEGILMTVFTVFSLLWCAFLVFAATLTIHNYTPGKTVGTAVLTVVGMAAVLFMAVLLVSLVQQLILFVYSMYNEILIRM